MVLQIMKEISITSELMAVVLYSHTLWCAPHAGIIVIFAPRAISTAYSREKNTLGRTRQHQFSILNRWV
jgi:hypothetical protein